MATAQVPDVGRGDQQTGRDRDHSLDLMAGKPGGARDQKGRRCQRVPPPKPDGGHYGDETYS